MNSDLLSINDEVVAEVADIALPENYGVAKKDGFVIFIPKTVTGDIVRVRIIKKDRHYAYGDIAAIEKPSPFRVDAPCPHFGICGGCTMQNLSYSKQLSIKENYLLQTLKRIGNLDTDKIDIKPIVPSPDRFYYRSKLELFFDKAGNKIRLGSKERMSPLKSYENKVIPLEKCMVFSRSTENIIPIFTWFAQKQPLTKHKSLTQKGPVSLTLREAKMTGELMAILETTDTAFSHLSGLWDVLSKNNDNLLSLYVIKPSPKRGAGIPGKKHVFFGKPNIVDKIYDITFKIYPYAFFQPNPKAAALLYKEIVDICEPAKHEHVLGLYCGMGAIEIFLSPFVQKVVGVDSSSDSIRNAIENCRINGIDNCTFFKGRVENILKDHNLSSVDLLVIDPPRAGISLQGLKNIIDTAPLRIAYVSCNPSTLARDIKYLQGYRYKVTNIIPFDFFPHSSHLETLTVMVR